jgi:multidrug efflux pump subunit AcrB
MLAHALLSRRAVIVLAAILLAVAGRHSFREMPRALEPRVEAPYAAIELQLPGASVAEIDAVLTPRVERELIGVPDVFSVESATRDGAVVWLVELPNENGAREAALGRIEERLASLRATLGAELIGLRGPNLLRPPSRFPEILIAIAGTRAAAAARGRCRRDRDRRR